MKRTFLSLLALIAMGSSVMAGDTPVISVADVYARHGDVVSFSVNLDDGKADTYTAMTLYAQFPTGFTTTGAYTVASGWTGTTCAVKENESGLVTIPFASSNPIPGSAVKNLVTVSFQVATTVATGNYDVTLKGTMFEYNTSDKDYADDVTFRVHVTDRVVLDENSTIAPTAQSGVNVTVNRTIKAGVWNTICLPFAMTEAQLKTAFGEGVKLAYLDINNGYSVDGTSLSINFRNWDVSWGLYANYPVLIKTTSNVEEFNVDNADIAANEASSVQTWEKQSSTPPFVKETLAQFFGTLKAGTTIPADYLFLKDNKFYYSTGTTEIKGFRGYFWLKDFTSASPAPTLNVTVDGQTTKVEGLSIVREDGEYYDLKGQRVSNPTQKGIYIKNGKKVIVK